MPIYVACPILLRGGLGNQRGEQEQRGSGSTQGYGQSRDDRLGYAGRSTVQRFKIHRA